MKSMPGDIMILHISTINENHMMYGSWDMECGWQNFCSFCTNFCTFTPLTAWKIKTLKKWKNWRYHFTLVYHKWQSYDVWFPRYGARLTEFFSFGTIFCPFTPLTTQKIEILKNERNGWRFHHLQKGTENHDHMLYCF